MLKMRAIVNFLKGMFLMIGFGVYGLFDRPSNARMRVKNHVKEMRKYGQTGRSFDVDGYRVDILKHGVSWTNEA